MLVEHPFRMSSERCWLMVMIVVELITNAVRHAFDQEGGTIRIECRASGEFVNVACPITDRLRRLTSGLEAGSKSSKRLRRILTRTFSLILERMGAGLC